MLAAKRLSYVACTGSHIQQAIQSIIMYAWMMQRENVRCERMKKKKKKWIRIFWSHKHIIKNNLRQLNELKTDAYFYLTTFATISLPFGARSLLLAYLFPFFNFVCDTRLYLKRYAEDLISTLYYMPYLYLVRCFSDFIPCSKNTV